MMAGKVDIATTMIDPNPAPGWRCCNIVTCIRLSRLSIRDMYWTGNVFYRFIFLDLPRYLKGKLLPYENNARKCTIKTMIVKRLLLTMSS
jgi:hypothetical protein